MSRNDLYIQGNLAYKYRGSVAQPAERPRRERDIDILPGGRRQENEYEAGQTFAIRAAKITVLFALVFAGFGFARITLDAATINEGLAAKQCERQLEAARSAISDLQAEQSSLSNPARIKNKAALLGMGSPKSISVIDISGDIVEVDDKGNLSITKSLQALVDKKAKASKK